MKPLQKKKALELQIKELGVELATLETSKAYKKQAAIWGELQRIMKKHKASPKELIDLLNTIVSGVSASPSRTPSKRKRTRRSIVTYENPHSGEIVKTRGGNHRILKLWRAEFGDDAVRGWRK